jgi:hypothetical protein
MKHPVQSEEQKLGYLKQGAEKNVWTWEDDGIKENEIGVACSSTIQCTRARNIFNL